MENIFLFYDINSSDVNSDNSSLLGEFPYWQPALAFSLFCNIAVPFGTVSVLYLPLLLVLFRLLKNEQLKVFNLIHVSLLIAAILDDILRTCLYCIYLPSALRYCICSNFINAMLYVEYIFFLIYRPLAFACLSVLQCLVIIGKRKLANIKVACGMIALCIGISFVSIVSIVRLFYEMDITIICYASTCPRSGLEIFRVRPLVIFFFLSVVATFASLAIVIVTSIWSCAIFRTYYAGGDDQLNHKMLSLPFIMPLVIISTPLLEGVLRVPVAHFLSTLSLDDLLPYWIAFSTSILSSVLRVLIRLPYPLILLYTHTRLRQAVKGLLNQLRNRSQVTPDQ